MFVMSLNIRGLYKRTYQQIEMSYVSYVKNYIIHRLMQIAKSKRCVVFVLLMLINPLALCGYET